MIATQTHPLPTLLGAGMINMRQKGAWEQCGLWSAEECLRTPLYHQPRDIVSEKLFPHYIMSSACKQQPSTEPAQQNWAGGEQWKGKIRHQELPFHEDKQHESTLLSILRRCFVLGGQSMGGTNAKGTRRQHCTMLFVHLPKQRLLYLVQLLH